MSSKNYRVAKTCIATPQPRPHTSLPQQQQQQQQRLEDENDVLPPLIPPLGYERQFCIKTQRQQATPQYLFPQAGHLNNENFFDDSLMFFTTDPKVKTTKNGITRDQYNFSKQYGYEPQSGIYTSPTSSQLYTTQSASQNINNNLDTNGNNVEVKKKQKGRKSVQSDQKSEPQQPDTNTPPPDPLFSDIISNIGKAGQLHTSRVTLRQAIEPVNCNAQIDPNADATNPVPYTHIPISNQPITRLEHFIDNEFIYISDDYHNKLVSESEAQFALFDILNEQLPSFGSPSSRSSLSPSSLQIATQLASLSSNEILQHVDFNAIDFTDTADTMAQSISPIDAVMILTVMNTMGVLSNETGAAAAFADPRPFMNTCPRTFDRSTNTHDEPIGDIDDDNEETVYSDPSNPPTTNANSTKHNQTPKTAQSLSTLSNTDDNSATNPVLSSFNQLIHNLKPYNELTSVHFRNLLLWSNNRQFYGPLLKQLEVGCQRTLVDKELIQLIDICTKTNGDTLPEFLLLRDFILIPELRTFLFQDFALLRSEQRALQSYGLSPTIALSIGGEAFISESWFPNDTTVVNIVYTYLIHLVEADVTIAQYSTIVQFVQFFLYLFDSIFETTLLTGDEFFHFQAYKQYWFTYLLDKYKDPKNISLVNDKFTRDVIGSGNSSTYRPKYWVSDHLTKFHNFMAEHQANNSSTKIRTSPAFNDFIEDNNDIYHDDSMVQLPTTTTTTTTATTTTSNHNNNTVYSAYDQLLLNAHPFLPSSRADIVSTDDTDVNELLRRVNQPNKGVPKTSVFSYSQANPHLALPPKEIIAANSKHNENPLWSQLIESSKATDDGVSLISPMLSLQLHKLHEIIQGNETNLSVVDTEALEVLTDEQLANTEFLERFGAQVESVFESKQVHLTLDIIHQDEPPVTTSTPMSPTLEQAIHEVQLDLDDFVFRPSEHYGLLYLLRLIYILPNLRFVEDLPAEFSQGLVYHLQNFSQWILQQNELHAQARKSREEQLFRLRSFLLQHGLKSNILSEDKFACHHGRSEKELLFSNLHFDHYYTRQAIEEDVSRNLTLHHEHMKSKESSIRVYMDELRNFKRITKAIAVQNELHALVFPDHSSPVSKESASDLHSDTITGRTIQYLRQLPIAALRGAQLERELVDEYSMVE